MPADPDLSVVPSLLREAADREILPRFRALSEGEIEEKRPGDLVTAADREAERLLTGRLREVLDVPVVGEEAVAADPGLLDRVAGSPMVWVVDPVDGTSNFVDGSEDFGVMVALVEAEVPIASWILHPVDDVVYHAVRGGGAWRDEERLTTPEPAPGLDALTVVMKSSYLPADRRDEWMGRAHARTGAVSAGRACCAKEYPDVVEGRTGGVIYWRTYPWDHAAGSLLAIEAGCVAVRADGSSYRAGGIDGGLLAAHVDVAERLRLAVFEP